MRTGALALSIVVASTAVCQTSPWPSTPQVAPDYSVLYTARSFGYFRYPNLQRTTDHDCASKDPNYSVLAEQYMHDVTTAAANAQLRVAMGDNFAPELLARKMLEPPASASNGKTAPAFRTRDLYSPYWSAPKKQMVWESDSQYKPSEHPDEVSAPPLHGTVPSDNVACFFQKAHFDAIVPGKDDFYFGPERLSAVARFLGQPHGNDFPAVPMLGANLVVTTTRRTPAATLKCTHCKEEPAGVQVKLPGAVLPWLQSIDVKGADNYSGHLCPAGSDLENFDLPKSYAGCKSWVAGEQFSLTRKKYGFTLTPNQNYAFCLAKKSDARKNDAEEVVFCKLFTVRQPLLQVAALKVTADKKADIDPLSPSSYSNCDMSTHLFCDIDAHSAEVYALPNGNHSQVAIFGVVDPNLPKQVGELNYAWNNDNKNFVTAVTVVDPADTLKQVLEMCDNDSRCNSRPHKILLAQMPLATARQMIAKLGELRDKDDFELVITQDDPSEFTGSVWQTKVVHRKVEGGTTRQVAALNPFFVVPARHFEIPSKQNHLSVRVQRVDVYNPVPSTRVPVASFQNVVTESAIVEPAMSSPASELYRREMQDLEARMAEQYSSESKAGSKPETGTGFALVTLKALQKACKSDAAVLQSRDIYSDFALSSRVWFPNPDAEIGTPDRVEETVVTAQNFLDEIVWKGDIAICQTLTGADLLRALKQTEASPESLALKALGAEPDKLHGTYIVHGNAIDEKKTYTVAMPDYLAFGDTGYPDLKGTDLPPVETIRSINNARLPLVADDVSELLFNKPPEPADPNHFDDIAATPPDMSRGLTVPRQSKEWFERWIIADPNVPVLIPRPNLKAKTEDKLRLNAQHRPLTYFNVEKLSVSYNLTSINGPQQLVPNRFGGISTVPQLQALESQSVTVWQRLRFGHEFARWVDFFGVTETRYGFTRSRLRASSTTFYDPYSVSVSENGVSAESGLLSKRVSKNVPFRFLVSERLWTQLRDPLVSYSAPVIGGIVSGSSSNCDVTSIDIAPPITAKSSANILCAAPRSYLLETKIGTRLENQSNWIEFGYEVGHNYQSPKGYVFNGNTPQQFVCSAATNQSISSCVTNSPSANINYLSPLSVSSQTLLVSGWFTNFKLAVPVVGKMVQLNLENYFEAFRKHDLDTSADTRFYEDVIISLPVKFRENLSFSPQMEVFDYQNKVLPHHFMSLTNKVTLDYSFDWHTKSSWKKVAAFPDPSSVSKNAPLPPP